MKYTSKECSSPNEHRAPAGLVNLQFSLATAAGLLKSLVSFGLIVSSYIMAYKFADYKVF